MISPSFNSATAASNSTPLVAGTNLTGCPIIALSDEEVILDNSGTKLKYKINPSNMNLEEKKKLLLLLKPLLWWGD